MRLTLLTTQSVPLAKDGKNKGKPDPNQAIRLAKAVTIPADKNESAADVVVPASLALLPYDLAIKAELLSADGKRVVAAAVTPAQRFSSVKPSFGLELAGAAKIEVVAGGEPVKLAGTIVRKHGYAHKVKLTLKGLPKGVPAPSIEVAGDKQEFELALALPESAKPGALKVKLVATSEPAPKQVVKATNDVALELQVKAPAK